MPEDLNITTTEDTQGQADTQPTAGSQPDTNNAAPNAAEPPKTFTQEELEKIIDKRLKREREKAKAAQKTDAERISDLENKLTASERKNAVTAANCNPTFAKFVMHEVGEMDGDFSENLAKFKKDNPQYFTSATNTIKFSSAPNLSGAGKAISSDDIMNKLLRGIRR